MSETTAIWGAVRTLQQDVARLIREVTALQKENAKLKSDMMSRTDPRLYDGH